VEITMATKSNADYGEEQRREYAVEDLCAAMKREKEGTKAHLVAKIEWLEALHSLTEDRLKVEVAGWHELEGKLDEMTAERDGLTDEVERLNGVLDTIGVSDYARRYAAEANDGAQALLRLRLVS
jgi:hypothetical protein